MTKLKFSINVPASTDKLMRLAMDYENFRNYLPDQIKSIKILETKNDETITEEIIVFRSYIKAEIKQKSVHKKDGTDTLLTEIISGPFKGTTLKIRFESNAFGTKITILANMKIPLKYKIASLVIKKSYKIFLTGIIYKINSSALESS